MLFAWTNVIWTDVNKLTRRSSSTATSLPPSSPLPCRTSPRPSASLTTWCRMRCRSWCRGSCCRPSRRSSGSWSPNLRRRLPTTPSRRSSLAWSPSRSSPSMTWIL